MRVLQLAAQAQQVRFVRQVLCVERAPVDALEQHAAVVRRVVRDEDDGGVLLYYVQKPRVQRGDVFAARERRGVEAVDRARNDGRPVLRGRAVDRVVFAQNLHAAIARVVRAEHDAAGHHLRPEKDAQDLGDVGGILRVEGYVFQVDRVAFGRLLPREVAHGKLRECLFVLLVQAVEPGPVHAERALRVVLRALLCVGYGCVRVLGTPRVVVQ